MMSTIFAAAAATCMLHNQQKKYIPMLFASHNHLHLNYSTGLFFLSLYKKGPFLSRAE